MAEVINLRRARKARAKSQKEEQAAQNRLLFGMSKAERVNIAAERAKDKQQLDGHLLTSTLPDEGDSSSHGDPS